MQFGSVGRLAIVLALGSVSAVSVQAAKNSAPAQVMMVAAAQPKTDVVAEWYRRLERAATAQAPELIDVLREQIPEYGNGRNEPEAEASFEPPMIATLATAAH